MADALGTMRDDEMPTRVRFGVTRVPCVGGPMDGIQLIPYCHLLQVPYGTYLLARRGDGYYFAYYDRWLSTPAVMAMRLPLGELEQMG